MTSERTLTGGARLDMMNATWPFAKLSATKEWITLKVNFLGDYTLHASQVVVVKKYTIIPFLAWGIRIHHGIGKYPKKMIFWSLGFPAGVLDFLREEGFPEEKMEPTSRPTANADKSA